jgi:HEPN domain-containing protein
MKDVEHAAMMLGMARIDLRAVKGMVDSAIFADEVFGFHAQQVVEKSLKAWLSVLGAGYPRIHDIEELLNLLEDQGAEIPEHFRDLTELTVFSVQYRYEYFEEADQATDRAAMISRLQGVLDKVAAIVCGDTDEGIKTPA